MYRVILAALVLSAGPMAFGQDLEVASCKDCKREPLEKKPPPRILIKANCALPDGTVLAQQLIEVDGGLSADEKRALAEQACEPILREAAEKCDELAARVETIKREWVLAELHSYREHRLAAEIKKTLAAAPAYCKEPGPPK
ncbi:MAG TPA: hypothetical protein VFS52_23000 [Steroidobacteraceae bacterium]|nr:hypothetical protein [Steroidobacteraceae bacterium]